LSVYPISYMKGALVYAASAWGVPGSGYAATCANEDVNRDGSLGSKVVNGVTVTEDTNGDGVLTPGLPGFVSPSSLTTGTSGSSAFTLNYGEQYAPWVYFQIKATATVAGTETSAVFYYTAAPSVEDVSDANAPPSGRYSPFGQSTSCNDAL
jgi:hypothetical protein